MIHEIKNISTTQPVRQSVEEYGKEMGARAENFEFKTSKILSSDEVENIIKEMNEFIQIFNPRIAFELDKETGKTVLKIIDAQTKEVIRQIPPEELLRISKRISELLGLIINAKV